MLGEAAKQGNRIVGRSEVYSRAVDVMPMAVGGKIVAHQCFRQPVTDDREVQILECKSLLRALRCPTLAQPRPLSVAAHLRSGIPMVNRPNAIGIERTLRIETFG